MEMGIAMQSATTPSKRERGSARILHSRFF